MVNFNVNVDADIAGTAFLRFQGPPVFRSQSSVKESIREDDEADVGHVAFPEGPVADVDVDVDSDGTDADADADADADTDDEVSRFLDSVAAGAQSHCPAKLHKELSALHKVIDERGDLEDIDLLDVLYACGVENPQDRMHQLMRKIDTDGDQKISRDELEFAMKLWGQRTTHCVHPTRDSPRTI